MTDDRVRRGRQSEHLAANYLLPLFPQARAVGNSLPGRDILGTSAGDIEWIYGDPETDISTIRGIAPEVKARSRFEPLKAMTQAKRNAGKDIPMVILRMNGQGDKSVGDWLAMFTLRDARELIGRAFQLGQYAGTTEQSSSEECGEGSISQSGIRLGSDTNHSGNALLEERLSSFLHDVGILSRDQQVSIHGGKGQFHQSSVRGGA